MKTNDNNNVPEPENSSTKDTEQSFNEDILYKMPSVALAVLFSTSGEIKPMHLVYANRSLLKLTGHDPETLKREQCDFFALLLHPEDLHIMTKALDHLAKHPGEDLGLIFRINAAWDECLHVICNCRVVDSDQPGQSLAICIWEVFNQNNFPKEAMRECLKLFDRKEKEKKLQSLTPRETEILGLLGKGLSYAEISKRLFISYRTVDTHITNIKSKLGIRCINALTAFAVSAGLG